MSWVSLRGDIKFTNSSTLFNHNPLDELKAKWNKVSQLISLLNVPFSGDVENLFDELRWFLNENNQADAVSLVMKSLIEVNDRHLKIVVDSTLNYLKTNFIESDVGHRRIHLELVSDLFSGIFNKDDLNQKLDSLIQRGFLNGDLIEHFEGDPLGYELQFLAACIFISADR